MQQLTNTNVDTERLKQLARYLAHGIGAAQAGSAVGYSESKVLTLCDHEEFQELLRIEKEEIVKNYVDTNSMYDRIEKTALSNIEKALKFNSDPDFNMRVAMLANRAQRRGTANTPDNRPIDAAAADGRRITLSFSQHFVNIVQNGALQKTSEVSVHRAELDVATPQEVGELLQIRSFRNLDAEGVTPMAEIRKLADFLE